MRPCCSDKIRRLYLNFISILFLVPNRGKFIYSSWCKHKAQY